jgi:phenylacetate-CoA ligase
MYARIYSFLRHTFGPGGPQVRRNLHELEESQWWSKSDIEAKQLEQLRRLIRHAYDRSAFYRHRLDTGPVHPDDIASLGDLSAIRPLTKQELRDNADTITVRGFEGEAYLQGTGGSTGEPLQFMIDRASSWWSAAVQIRGRRWYGVEPGERQAWIWGTARELPAEQFKDRLLAAARRRRFLNGFLLEEQRMRQFAAMLQRWQPSMIRAYSASLYVFARHLEATNVGGINPKLIETTAEKLAPGHRELFEKMFRAPVADLYSCRELLDVAYQCPQQRLHVAEPFIVEVVEGSRSVEAGRVGELAITSLHQLATPLIRYKLGDRGSLDPLPCPCGRGMPVLAEVNGRVEDYIILGDGRPVWGASFHIFFYRRPEIARFQVYQDTAGEAEVRLELRQKIDPGWLEDLPRTMSDFFGGQLSTVVKVVDHIDLTGAGKLRNVVSELKISDPQ